MVAVGQVKDLISQNDLKLRRFAQKLSGQRTVAGFCDDAFANPLPKLILRGPIFISVAAHDERVFLFLLLFFRFRLSINVGGNRFRFYQ